MIDSIQNGDVLIFTGELAPTQILDLVLQIVHFVLFSVQRCKQKMSNDRNESRMLLHWSSPHPSARLVFKLFRNVYIERSISSIST